MIKEGLPTSLLSLLATTKMTYTTVYIFGQSVFAELVLTGLWAVWAEQLASFSEYITQFLPRPTRKESNVPKMKSS